jgi:hypothetical protein
LKHGNGYRRIFHKIGNHPASENEKKEANVVTGL